MSHMMAKVRAMMPLIVIAALAIHRPVAAQGATKPALPARITERTPWDTHSIAGVGAPPYQLTGA